jgi:serine/threonine protein kinase
MEPLSPNDPERIDEFVLEGRLGTGGYGIVYAATDPEGRRVALKVLRSELADNTNLRERLKREGDALSRVGGDRNVEIYKVQAEGSHTYLAMELVEGETLQQRVDRDGPLVGPILWFTAQGLIEALEAIHEAGVTHRDLKPSNIMFGPDGVKVLDFGISAVAEEAGLTQTGAFLGTAAWISPEQILGREVTEKCDVFNLGLVLGFAATGRHPYGVGRPDALMYRISNMDADLEGVDEPLHTALQRCLRRDASQRPTTGELLGFFASGGQDDLPGTPVAPSGSTVIVQPRDLDRAVQSAASRKVEPSTESPKPKRKRRVVGLLALVLLSGAGGAAAWFATQQTSNKAATTTVAPVTIAAPTTTTAVPATTAAATTTTAAPTRTTALLATTATQAMPAPRTNAGSDRSIVVSWDQIPGAVGYQLKLEATGASTKNAWDAVSPHTFTGLYTNLSYRVSARYKLITGWESWSVPSPYVRPVTPRPPTTLAPVVTTSAAPTASAAELAQEAILTAPYFWGYSSSAKQLQELLGLTADGNYGEATRTGHLAVLRQRGFPTTGVPSPPPTTTTTTTVSYTHPSKMVKPNLGTPYLVDTYVILVSWKTPSQSGSSSVKTYEIRSGSDTWTVSGAVLSTSLNLISAQGRSFEIRAVNYENRAGKWSDKAWIYDANFPTTTTIAVPRYKLEELEGKNVRWDPCAGPVTMKLNHGGRLSSTQLNDWEAGLLGLASEISDMTGLELLYLGTTTAETRQEHPGGRPHAGGDILISIAPAGTSLMSGFDDSYFGHRSLWWNGSTNGIWEEVEAFDIQVSTQDATSDAMWNGGDRGYLMYFLGESFGLLSPGDGIDTEIMSWGGSGSGTWNDPDWGEGDKIAFGLVGAGSGCIK